MKVAALISGGKDSIYALYKAQQEGHEVVALVSFVPRNKESYMFHIPNIEHAGLFEKALGIPINIFQVSGDKEFEVGEMKAGVFWVKQEYKIEGLVSGAIESNYQKERVDWMCGELGLKSIAPLWHIDKEKYLHEFVKAGFKAKIVGVFAEGLGKEWLGRDIDAKAIEELKKLNEKYSVSIVGEGGEYESFVLDGPIFKKKINIIESEIIWEHNSGIFKIKKAKLS